MMKRIAIIIVLVLFMFSGTYSAEVHVGVSPGIGTLSHSELLSEYGSSFVYCLYVGAELFNGMTINVGYEGGYSKSSSLVYDSILEISGFQLFGEYSINMGKTFTFVKWGIAVYMAKRSFTAPELKEYDFTETNPGFLFGFGMKIPLTNSIQLKVELIDLTVQMKPFYGWVDAGGVRILAGLVINFNI